MKEDAEFRQVAELLAAVVDRVTVADSVEAEVSRVIRDWLRRMGDDDADLTSFLADELDRAFPI